MPTMYTSTNYVIIDYFEGRTEVMYPLSSDLYNRPLSLIHFYLYLDHFYGKRTQIQRFLYEKEVTENL